MDRETKDIGIGGNTFTIKTYATALEVRTIQDCYFKGAKVELVGTQPKISDFNPSVQFEVEKAMIQNMVVSLNGSTDNIVGRCINLPNEIYMELIQAVDALVSKKKS